MIEFYTVETFEHFLTQPENRDRLFELIYGEIVEKMPTEEHGIIVLNIGSAIRHFLKTHPIGRVSVETCYRLPDDPKNASQPDLSFISATHQLAIVRQGAVLQMPDLAVEVRSPDDTLVELRAKAAYYLKHGTSLVWLIDPTTQSAEVQSRLDTGAITSLTIDRDGHLDGQTVLPGFRLSMSEVFEA
ncbi:MAG: Uma2 family endonuclease [Anaerolineae bacterium]|nr:Uma2 family endonuclease [Anaerolineae bacterium]